MGKEFWICLYFQFQYSTFNFSFISFYKYILFNIIYIDIKKTYKHIFIMKIYNK